MEIVPALPLARALMRRPSVTPADEGALDVIQEPLAAMGFTCHRLTFGEVDNLYARFGAKRPNFCFAGHTDVVPVGDAGAWTADPFGAEVRDGRLWGRGAADMKAAVACFVSAASMFLARHEGGFEGSISLLITGDEEGDATDGTVKVLDWMKARGEAMDACLVGEPTSPETLGQVIKIGRRGSLNGKLTVHGTQGHAAYPERADNPLPRLARMLTALTAEPIDQGNAHFQPTTLTLTTVDVGNPATNVIPAKGRAGFNIRYNNDQSPETLEAWIRARLDAIGRAYDLETATSGDAFLTPPGELSAVIADAAERVTGIRPELNTTGGTSDARFIKDHCPVAEFGMVGATSHKVDENIPADDVDRLAEIYLGALEGYFRC